MKKIALDLDGVVFDTENLFRVYSEIYDVDIIKKDSVIDNKIKNFQNRFDWKVEDKIKFYKRYSKEILSSNKLMAGSDLVLKKLKDKYEFVVVTSRTKEEAEYAIDFFNSIGFNNIKIYYGQIKKVDKLIELNVDYLIEDDDSICINTSMNKITALYFKNSACNDVVENENLKTVHNWGEIYKYLLKK